MVWDKNTVSGGSWDDLDGKMRLIFSLSKLSLDQLCLSKEKFWASLAAN